MHLILCIGRSFPGFLNRVDGFSEVQVVFIRLVEQAGGGNVTCDVVFEKRSHLTQTAKDVTGIIPVLGG